MSEPSEFFTSRASCLAREVVPDWSALERPGDFYISGNHMTIWLPGHTKWVGVTTIPVRGEHAWNWDGNRVTPTLNPSIRVTKPKRDDDPEIELWHGHFHNGYLKSC